MLCIYILTVTMDLFMFVSFCCCFYIGFQLNFIVLRVDVAVLLSLSFGL